MPCLGSFGLQEPRPIYQNSVPLSLAGCLHFSPPERVCSGRHTPCKQPAQDLSAAPGPACGQPLFQRKMQPYEASTWPDGSFEGGSWEAKSGLP